MTVKVTRYTKQDMLYWEKDATSPTGYRPAVAMRVRWEDVQEQVLMLDGRVITSSAHVMATAAIKAGALIFLGTVADWRRLPTYPRVPNKQQGGFEVFKSASTPDRRGRIVLFEGWA